ncbi:MAG: pilin [Clostridia bacterium]
MKKFLKRIFIILISVIILFTVNCFAADEKKASLDVKELVNQEEGSLFDKTIAKTIGGIAQAVYNIATNEELDIGFKTYEEMLFKGGDVTSPFSDLQWNLIMQWYRFFSYISGSLILIAVVIISYKMIASAISTVKRNEAKENLMHLLFGGVAIAIAPTFVKFLLFLNNSLVNILVQIVSGDKVNNLLDNEFLSSISTGNPIATALVISMFIYIFVKLNIKFIVREFTLIVFTIFTPIVVGLWVINKNVTAVAIWGGQIMINAFMQFIYCFLFLLFSSFISETAGWAVTLIWAMMLLPIADVLMNCLQNLTSRIAGLDNNEVALRGVGLGAAFGTGIGYSINAIKTQFTNSNSSNSEDGNSGFMGRVKNFISPQMNLSAEKDYNGNNNPIRNVLDSKNITNTNSTTNTNTNRNEVVSNVSNNNINNSSKSMRFASGAYQATKGYLKIGANMAEGNFNNNQPNKYSNDVKNNSNIVAERNINEKINSEKVSDANEEI